MRPFSYARATDADSAIAMVAGHRDGVFLAGGTTEVDLVRQNVLRPGLLVDINDLPLNGVEDLSGGGLRIGALARMSEVAQAASVVERFPVISQALLLGASAQLLPGDTPEREHPLEHGELITAIEVPGARVARQFAYLKFRDRESYEFALVSVAAAVQIQDDVIAEVRLALGGVGTKPWRARRAERSLLGQPAEAASFAAAAREELAAAAPRPLNAFKVELAQRAIVRALTTLSNGDAR
jgi:CO/xanthine dehydrogenase FAD-binding subunit